MFSFGSIARVHPLFLFKYFFYTSKSDDITPSCSFLTFFGLGRIMGLGVGTVLAAFTMGKCIGLIGGWMDRRVSFVSILSRRQAAAAEEG